MVTYLSDAVPVDDDALGVERVPELDVDGVAGPGADRRARELPVDADHHLLLAVGRPEHVADLPPQVPGLARRRAMLARHQGAAHQGQQREMKPHGCPALQSAVVSAASYATPQQECPRPQFTAQHRGWARRGKQMGCKHRLGMGRMAKREIDDLGAGGDLCWPKKRCLSLITSVSHCSISPSSQSLLQPSI